MIFSDRPADVNALLAQAATIIKAIPDSDNKAGTIIGPKK